MISMTLQEEANLKYPLREPCCRLVKAKILWQREQYIAKNADKYKSNSEREQGRPKEV